MSIRIPWDKYETALLIDTCIRIINNAISTDLAACSLSDDLRYMALKRGIEIDDKYRNYNGMVLQMSKMNYLLTNGKVGLPGSSKMFIDMANLYKDHISLFENILKEAKNIVSGNEKSTFQISTDKSHNEMMFINFNDSAQQLAFCKVIYLEYFGVRYELKNWTDLYVKIVSILYKRNSELIELFLDKNISYDKGRIDVTKEHSESMIAPKYVTDGIYIETNLNARNIIDKIKKILIIYNIDFDDIRIAYISNSNTRNMVEGESDKSMDSVFDIDSNDCGYKSKYKAWLKNVEGKAVSTINIYSWAITKCEQYARSAGYKVYNIYNNYNTDSVCLLINTLLEDSTFKDLDIQNSRQLSASLKKYLKFLTCNTAENMDTQKNDQHDNDVVNTPNVSEENIMKHTQILNDFFPEGFRLGNYMHQIRYKDCYEKEFGETLEAEGDNLDKLLNSVGQVIDNRVYALEGDGQNELLKEIYSDIEETFNRGASCIFLDCLYDKYNQRLVSEMNIYNVDILWSFINNDSNKPRNYKYGKSRITKYGVDDSYSLEIKRIMSESHVPMTYDDVQKKIWYIRMDKIKSTLVCTDDIVKIDDATYFYAPNFSISAEELATLVYAMDSAISCKGYIVAKDIRTLFREKCPSASMDSEHYKDYAIRNILGSLLKDKFEFTSSVVTVKGTELNMSQVYKNFAMEHEYLTLNEIKDFSESVGVQAYWGSILEEMIRISDTELVNKNKIHFDIALTDNVIETICVNDYMSIKDIDLFLSFPSIEYKWNGFILECYLMHYSEKFSLVQLNISSDNYNGIVVKNSSKLKTYEDLAADMLAHCDDWNDEKTAIECLVNKGFQQRRAYNKISSVIKRAKQIKESINNEG